MNRREEMLMSIFWFFAATFWLGLFAWMAIRLDWTAIGHLAVAIFYYCIAIATYRRARTL